MTNPSTLLHDAGELFQNRPLGQLAELTCRMGVDGLEKLCRNFFKDRSLAQVVATLFPEDSPFKVAEVARRIGLNAIRNSCWKSIMQAPGSWDIKIAAPDREATAALRAHQGPAILAFWHFGPVLMLTMAFRHIGVPVLAISRAEANLWTNVPDLRKMRINIRDTTPQQIATAMRQSVEHLKQGGKVAVALDGSLGKNRVPVPFLGRHFAVGRGAAGLARATGAPIIPCTMQWDREGWGMSLRIFDPVPLPAVPPENKEAFEQALLTSVARRFEEHGRRYPGQFWIDQLAKLIDSPSLIGH